MRAATVPIGQTDPLPAKPLGGYLLIPAVRIALAWTAYRQRLIRLADLRAWFALHEMLARRRGRPAPLPCRFALDELRALTGLTPRRLKESLRRLEQAALLTWSESAITFPATPEAVPLPDRAAFRRFFDAIPNRRRLVPIPRRILRLLAGGARPALIATVLGHLLRCLYLTAGRCSARGRVKASWIAETFGVGLRRVKQARHELIALGWLIPLEADQWALNRWGAHVRINLTWSRLDALPPVAPPPGPGLAPPPAAAGPALAPPDSDEEPLAGAKNQEPAAGGPAGFFLNPLAGEKTPESGPVVTRPAPHSTVERSRNARTATPDLRHIEPEDLKDTGRLLALYEQAVGAGLAAASEWGRLRFVAAAEHARVIGTRNPCGLLARLVRGGLYHFATQDDETAASVRLRRHLYGAAPVLPAGQGGVNRPEPPRSDDARLVSAVRAAAIRAGYRGDAFPLLKRAQPEWTRERWDRAVAELKR